MRGWPGVWRGYGDRRGGVGDDSGQAADDGLAGDSAVFVVVAQVGVEAAGEPALGVVDEEPEHHLQASTAGAQHRVLGLGVDLVGGQFGGISRRAAMAAWSFFRAAVIARLAAGMALFFAAAVVPGSASSAARARSAAASPFSASRTAAFAALRAGLPVTLVFTSILAA